jgi:UDP-N-acetylmuramyl-tripeptide synthetase
MKKKIVASLPFIRGVWGRMQKVASYKGASIFIDYAHTPSAMESVLKAAKRHCKKNLVLVFGCGGNRDVDKRSIMGKIANDYADFVIVTDDNPRFEDPASIRKQILLTCSKGIEIECRTKAIERAIELLNEGDVLIIAGKGHETYQIINDTKLFFNDELKILEYLKRKPKLYV